MPVLELTKKTIVASTPVLGGVGLVLFERGAFPFSGLWLLFVLKERFSNKDGDVGKSKPLSRISVHKQFFRDVLRVNMMELTPELGLSSNIVAHVLLNRLSPGNIIGRSLGRCEIRICTRSSRFMVTSHRQYRRRISSSTRSSASSSRSGLGWRSHKIGHRKRGRETGFRYGLSWHFLISFRLSNRPSLSLIGGERRRLLARISLLHPDGRWCSLRGIGLLCADCSGLTLAGEGLSLSELT